uniref:Uncharacterized protein n=1 Tax=Rhizophora mucronata TaxID=61149 RepID=A0A2P2Q584_RHIMU
MHQLKFSKDTRCNTCLVTIRSNKCHKRVVKRRNSFLLNHGEIKQIPQQSTKFTYK